MHVDCMMLMHSGMVKPESYFYFILCFIKSRFEKYLKISFFDLTTLMYCAAEISTEVSILAS